MKSYSDTLPLSVWSTPLPSGNGKLIALVTFGIGVSSPPLAAMRKVPVPTVAKMISLGVPHCGK